MNNKWSFAEVWNAALLEVETRPIKARDNLWASELGKSPIDLYLKMKGTEPTNPPNARSQRKFEAGNVFEWIVSLILKRAGILQESQKWCEYQFPGLLRVTGKGDFIAGGVPNFENAVKDMEALGLPAVFIRATEKIRAHFEKNHPNGLGKKPLEIKSVSSFMFDLLEFNKKAMKNHRLQILHYLIADNWDEGAIVYICRDDLRMMEVSVFNDEQTKGEYKEAIERISKPILSGERPPLEQAIVFDDDIGKFAKNFNVAYSNYLTLLYGFKDQMEFDDKYTPIVSRWNRVMARVKDGKKMTPKNLDVLTEIATAGFDVDAIRESFISTNENEDEE